MPVRSLRSAVLRWPDRNAILDEAARWALRTGRACTEIERILCYGSIVAGNWGVGSDLDIAIVLESSDKPFVARSADYDIAGIGVPVDCSVYTREELDRLRAGKARIIDELDNRSMLLYRKTLR